MTLVAYTREVSPTLADCELTHLERELAKAEAGVTCCSLLVRGT